MTEDGTGQAIVVSPISSSWKWESWSTSVVQLQTGALKNLLQKVSNIHQSTTSTIINTHVCITQF